VQITQLINHDGEVHRARYMPQKSSVIAIKTVNPKVHIFDCSKHPSKLPLDGKCNPDLTLRGHNEDGFGLSWSKFKQGHLLSSSYDGQICLWDIEATPDNKNLDAKQTFKGGVADLAWNLRNENLFGSVGDDQYLNIWDLRNSSVYQPIQGVIAHRSEGTCLAFNPLNEWVLATGSTDKTIKVFDLRKLTSALHTLDRHRDNIIQTMWNPKNERVLASCCASRRLMSSISSRILQEQLIQLDVKVIAESASVCS
ncbi:WD40 repeat-containing protein MSI1, partial [Tanacetum coccineum]